MKDISGRELKNRAIVLVNSNDYGLQFGIIDNLSGDLVDVILVFKQGPPLLECFTYIEDKVFIVAHRQLPEEIKTTLIEYSEVRIFGPDDRDIFHKKIGI